MPLGPQKDMWQRMGISSLRIYQIYQTMIKAMFTCSSVTKGLQWTDSKSGWNLEAFVRCQDQGNHNHTDGSHGNHAGSNLFQRFAGNRYQYGLLQTPDGGQSLKGRTSMAQISLFTINMTDLQMLFKICKLIHMYLASVSMSYLQICKIADVYFL